MSEQFSDVEITIASDIAKVYVDCGIETELFSGRRIPDKVRAFLAIRSAILHGDVSELDAMFNPKPVKEIPVPAVPPKKSVFPDYIICLEDGRKVKMLKRHLWTAFGMTPADYCEKWGLPVEYPMTAPNYAAKRAEIAKKSGLGKR